MYVCEREGQEFREAVMFWFVLFGDSRTAQRKPKVD